MGLQFTDGAYWEKETELDDISNIQELQARAYRTKHAHSLLQFMDSYEAAMLQPRASRVRRNRRSRYYRMSRMG